MPPTRYNRWPAARNRAATGSSSRRTGAKRSGITRSAYWVSRPRPRSVPFDRRDHASARLPRTPTISVGRVRQAIATPSARAELRAWPLDESIGHLVMVDVSMVPTPAQVDAWLEDAYTAPAPVMAVRTGALYPTAAAVFAERGFTVIDRLVLFERALLGRQPRPADRPSTTARLHRARRRDLETMATIDQSAFPAGWRNERAVARRHRRCDAIGAQSPRPRRRTPGRFRDHRQGGHHRLPAAHRRAPERAAPGRRTPTRRRRRRVAHASRREPRAGQHRRRQPRGPPHVRAGVVRAPRRPTRRRGTPPDGMNRALAATVVTFALVGIATTAFAQGDPEPPEPTALGDGSIRMELVDQTFDLTPGGTIELTYRLIGDLEAVAELVPPTTTTTRQPPPPTTTTTTTTTTRCARPDPAPIARPAGPPVRRRPRPTTAAARRRPPRSRHRPDRVDAAASSTTSPSTIRPN